MKRTLRLTQSATHDLTDILDWTIECFGAAQAQKYRQQLLNKCYAIATGDQPSRNCSVLLGPSARTDLRYVREARHFIIYAYRGQVCEVLAFLHDSTDLPSKIAKIEAMD